tara:strand:- start:113 stop:478 length:366 start_codon:yes stop_codon:yes gene_type:complete
MEPTADNVGITTTWSINGLRSLKSNGLVDSVSYVVYCREQVGVGLSATLQTNRYCHSMDLEGSSPTIALADLTEENVISWVKTGLGTTEVERIENSVAPPKTQYDYDDLREIREANSLPWS